MFSLRLIYSRKARPSFAFALSASVSPPFFHRLDAVTQAGRSHSDFASRQLHIEDSTARTLTLYNFSTAVMDISRNKSGDLSAIS